MFVFGLLSKPVNSLHTQSACCWIPISLGSWGGRGRSIAGLLQKSTKNRYGKENKNRRRENENLRPKYKHGTNHLGSLGTHTQEPHIHTDNLGCRLSSTQFGHNRSQVHLIHEQSRKREAKNSQQRHLMGKFKN